MSQLEGCPEGPIGLEDRRSRKVDLAFHQATLTEGPSGSDRDSNRRSGVGEGFAVHDGVLRSAAKLATLPKRRHCLQ